MDENQIIELFYPKAAQMLKTKIWKCEPLLREDILANGLLALVEAVHSWKDYCARNNADPEDLKYCWAYVSRRLKGSILDYWRFVDPHTREARDKAKLKGGNPDTPVWKLRQPMTIDATVHHATAVDAPPADSMILVHAAADKAVEVFESLSLFEQTTVAARMMLGEKWHELYDEVPSNLSRSICLAAMRSIREEVAVVLEAAPTVYPSSPKFSEATTKLLGDWEPSLELLKAIGGSLETFLKDFVEALRTEPQILNQILIKSRYWRRQTETNQVSSPVS